MRALRALLVDVGGTLVNDATRRLGADVRPPDAAAVNPADRGYTPDEAEVERTSCLADLPPILRA